MTEKKFHEMTSQERFDRVLQRKGDPFKEGCGFCHDCGYYPAFTPRVMVANFVTGEAEKYLLQLPPRCDACQIKRGLTRYSYLLPKPERITNWTDAWAEFQKDYPAWTANLLAKGIRDCMESFGVSKEEAKNILGVV